MRWGGDRRMLSGTIQDFGVADILQLIGHQAKTGRLAISNGVETIHILFREGAIVHAENLSAPYERLFGNLLVRAELLKREQLEVALEEQERTLRRIGAVLNDLAFIDKHVMVEMAQLQMTETLYSLFAWTRGTYEFEAVEIEGSPDGIEPIRTEFIIMNGIRMTDEWPSIREQIPSYNWMVEQMRPLPDTREDESQSVDLIDLGSGLQTVGHSEQVLVQLIAVGRSVQKLIDLSRLGEFETCRALGELIGGGYIRIVKPGPHFAEAPSFVDRARRVMLIAGRMGVSAALVVFAGGLIARNLAAHRAPQELRLSSRAIERRFEAVQLRVLRRALEIYHLRQGEYPEQLRELVRAQLVSDDDLRGPYLEPYVYKRGSGGDSFSLNAPLW